MIIGDVFENVLDVDFGLITEVEFKNKNAYFYYRKWRLRRGK